MARGDTKPPAHFGGDDTPPAPRGPQRLRYPCKAHGCPMPGTVDETCGWHYRESPQDWPKITDAIERWSCVARAINRLRTVMCGTQTCTDGKAHKAAIAEAMADIAAETTSLGWKRRIEVLPGEDIGDWCKRLERFLAARIKSDMTGREIDETLDTPVVAAMKKELRAKPLGKPGNAGDFL